LLSVCVAELTAFQCSKVLDVDDDTYPIISRYRDFSLKRHEAHRHSSELVSESIQTKLCCFFFLDMLFMRDLNLLSGLSQKCKQEIKCCVIASIIEKGLACRTMEKKKKKTSSRLTLT
jgi:hypothetical protein